MEDLLNANARAVLETLRASAHHPTAQEVYDEVRHARPRIGLATVYRILHKLAEQGVIKVWGYGSESARYDACTHRHDHAIDRRFEVSALAVRAEPGKPAASLVDRPDAAEDGDPVPRFLAVPDDVVPKIADRAFGEPLVGRLQFLEADDVRPVLAEPAQQDR